MPPCHRPRTPPHPRPRLPAARTSRRRPRPLPPRPPRPPKAPRRRSGGFVGALLVGGLAIAAYGATLSIHDAANWAGSDETVALAAALGVLGLGTLVLGLLGRRAGFTGFLAIVLALVTWTASVVPDMTFGGGIGERTWRPSATDTTAKYRLSIGSAELDLADAQDNPATAREIDARVGHRRAQDLHPREPHRRGPQLGGRRRHLPDRHPDLGPVAPEGRR